MTIHSTTDMQQCALAVSRRCNVTEGAGGCDEYTHMTVNHSRMKLHHHVSIINAHIYLN